MIALEEVVTAAKWNKAVGLLKTEMPCPRGIARPERKSSEMHWGKGTSVGLLNCSYDYDYSQAHTSIHFKHNLKLYKVV